MNLEITNVSALEILDSRGRPTLEVHVEIAGTFAGRAAVPSGASTGSKEAVERRDGDPSRYGGAGVLAVVEAVNGEIASRLVGEMWESQAHLDSTLRSLDGTEDKARLGANAIVGVSMAFARALAAHAGVPLYRWLAGPGASLRMPVPYFNVVNGGVHAKNRLDFQEFMIAPVGAPNFAEALRAGAEIYGVLRGRLDKLGFTTALGDEGGFAPALQAPEDVLDLLVESIGQAGYEAGEGGVTIALDLAASEFRSADGHYVVNGSQFDTVGLVEHIQYLVDRYPISSVEDGVGEDDREGWMLLTERLGANLQLVGDDNLVTNPSIIADAIDHRIGTAALIKPNQVGTVTETLEAVDLCLDAGFGVMVSHRSGETADTFIADLAVATGCGQFKSGAPARGERVVKYNRLLAIEAKEADIEFGIPLRR
ncbi:MAG: phosphopyruvate hydratase [Acidimicrobiales bacterium]